MRRTWIAFTIAGCVATVSAQNTAQGPLLRRQYVEGQQWVYQMNGTNNGKTYEVRIAGIVKKGDDGRWRDEYGFSDLIADGTPRALNASNQALRASVTLDGGKPFDLPDLAKAQQLIGPVLDLLSFYSDLFLAMHTDGLKIVGDHVSVAIPSTSSWADGVRVLIGEDHIDFDLTLTDIDRAAGLARLLVKHVPPRQPKIRVLADWMRPAVADTPNNWVQVEKSANGYTAGVGKETFDDVLTVRLSDGLILSAAMDNPVTAIERHCSDAELTRCGEPKAAPTFRHIEMSLIRDEPAARPGVAF